MGVDEARQPARRFVVLDEPHAAHVAGEVEDLTRTGDGLTARVRAPQVEPPVLDVGEDLEPRSERLCVDGANAVPPPPELGDHVAADEAAGAGDERQVVAIHAPTSPS